MSGGTFNYSQYRIEDMIELIEDRLDRQGCAIPDEDLYMSDEYYKDYPEEAIYEVYPEEIQNEFKNAIYYLKIAYIYAQRLDWYLAGDDGDESFLSRLEEDFNKEGIDIHKI